MKYSILFLASIMVIASSCNNDKKNETSETMVEVETSNVVQPDNAPTVDKLTLMASATPLPNYLNVLFKHKKELGINDEQLEKLKRSSDGRNPQAIKIATQIAANKKVMYNSSLEKVSKEELLTALDENLGLGVKIAVLKIGCRDEVIETLTKEQWSSLVKLYREEVPFDDKTEIMELVEHINPVPNYMQLVSNPALELDADQDIKIAEWQKGNNPQIAKLLRTVNSLEKDIYEISLMNESKSNILAKVEEISSFKKQILTLKTDCRDNLINAVLSEKQWHILVAK